MSVVQPKSINVHRFADSARRIRGEFDCALCKRLLDSINDCQGNIHVDLKFNRDEQGRTLITGAISVRVVMVCQRCLEPVVIRLDSEVSLVVVATEAEADQLSDMFNPLVVDGEQVSVIDLIEDELLLVLPAVVSHDSCEPPAIQENIVSEVADSRRENPFGVLEKLKI